MVIAPTRKGRLPDDIDPRVPGERIAQYEPTRQQALAGSPCPRIGTCQPRGLEDRTAAGQVSGQNTDLATEGQAAILGLRKALQVTKRQPSNGVETLRPERRGELFNPVVGFDNEPGVGHRFLKDTATGRPGRSYTFGQGAWL